MRFDGCVGQVSRLDVQTPFDPVVVSPNKSIDTLARRPPATQSMHVEFSDTARRCATGPIMTAFGVGRNTISSDMPTHYQQAIKRTAANLLANRLVKYRKSRYLNDRAEKLVSSDPTPRTPDATTQVTETSPGFPLRSLVHLWSLSSAPAPTDSQRLPHGPD